MEESFSKSLDYPSTLLGRLIFPTPTIQLFRLTLISADAYRKGAVIGCIFHSNSNLLMQMIVNTEKIQEYEAYLYELSQSRMKSYSAEINSILDFFIITELSKENLTFDELLERAKERTKALIAGKKLKQNFEEGIVFGIHNADLIIRLISNENKSQLHWEKAKIMELEYENVIKENDFNFYEKWAVYNMKKYTSEFFPEFVEPLGLNNLMKSLSIDY